MSKNQQAARRRAKYRKMTERKIRNGQFFPLQGKGNFCRFIRGVPKNCKKLSKVTILFWQYDIIAMFVPPLTLFCSGFFLAFRSIFMWQIECCRSQPTKAASASSFQLSKSQFDQRRRHIPERANPILKESQSHDVYEFSYNFFTFKSLKSNLKLTSMAQKFSLE